ncbi:MAG: agmatinase [Hyphomicrobium sp.]|nr:agmatinase [Hyphomicrobium sp.]
MLQHRKPLSTSTIASEQTFSGCASFLRIPFAQSASDADLAILGVPFDLATSNRPGARLGPQAIRAASAELADLKAYPGGFDPLDHVDVVDLGDVQLDFGNPLGIPAAIEAAAAQVIEDGAELLTLGGDHFITYALLRAHARKHGPLGLIQFDAHTDTWPSANPIDGPVELNHGTMFHRAVEEGIIDPKRSVQIGIRTWVDDPMGITILDADFVAERGVGDVARIIADVTAGGPSYLTVDIDCLDPAYAPGTGTRVTGGLTPRELNGILRSIRHVPIVGADVVEVAPAYDAGGITALAAATVVHEQIVRRAVRNGAEVRRYGHTSRI